MRLYHFDAHGENGPLATQSHTFQNIAAARQHAFHLAFRLARETTGFDQDGGAIIVQAYTAEDGVVLTVRVIANVEMTALRGA